MATNIWVGTAPLVAQIASAEITANDVATTYKITINNITVSVPGNAGGTSSTAADLAAACEASNSPYFSNIAWTTDASDVVATANTPGVPFSFTSSVTGGTGTIGAYTAQTSNSGPNDISVAANWSLNTLPVDNDTVIFANNTVNACWGLDALSSVQPALLRIDQTYTGLIGLEGGFATSSVGGGNSSEAAEYRESYLKVGPVLLYIGQSFSPTVSAGSGRIKINTGTDACDAIIFNSASTSNDANFPAIRILANDAATNYEIRSCPGGIGFAVGAGETTTVGDINITDTTTVSRVFSGPGFVGGTIIATGGSNVFSCTTINTVDLYGGVTTVNTVDSPTLVSCQGGTLNANFYGGTITTLTLARGGTINSKAMSLALAATTFNFGEGTLQLGTGGISATTINFTNPNTITLV